MDKHYSNGEITVDWQPEKCIHSTHCWKNLPRVFNPRARPWVNMEGADTEAIRKAVAGCPSGALSLRDDHKEEPAVSAPQTRIEALPDGPLKVSGSCELVTGGSSSSSAGKDVYLCRCGASSNKPFCDGSHRKIEFKA